MEIVSGIAGLFFLIAAVLAIVSIITPRTAFFLKNKTKKKAIQSWLIIAIGCLAIAGSFAPSADKEKTAVQQSKTDNPPLQGTVLQYNIVEKKEVIRAAIKRNRLDVTIVPVGDQSGATKEDFAATVMQAAKSFQKETGLPVVTVNMICQNTGNPFAEKQLAIATYAPDGKGIPGKESGGPVWVNVMAAERGFTLQELEFLRLWSEMMDSYQKNGLTDEEALNAAIYKKMGIALGTLKAHGNILQNMEVK